MIDALVCFLLLFYPSFLHDWCTRALFCLNSIYNWGSRSFNL